MVGFMCYLGRLKNCLISCLMGFVIMGVWVCLVMFMLFFLVCDWWCLEDGCGMVKIM